MNIVETKIDLIKPFKIWLSPMSMSCVLTVLMC